MLSSDPRNFNPLLVRSVRLKKTCAEFFKLIVQKQLPSVSLVSVLGFAGASWLTTAAIAPQIAQAYTANVDVSLTRQTREPFQSFLRRAESVARAATQRSFDRDILVTDVAVTVIGQNDGAIVPLLSLRVSRQAWRNRPDPQRWTRYFPDTQMLLGIKDTPPEQPDVPPQAPVEPTAEPQPPANAPQPGSVPTINIPGAPIQYIPNPGATTQQGGTPQPGGSPTGPTNINLPGANIRYIPSPGAAPNAAPAEGTPAPQPNNQQNGSPNGNGTNSP